jgi:hypothetical protein
MAFGNSQKITVFSEKIAGFYLDLLKMGGGIISRFLL